MSADIVRLESGSIDEVGSVVSIGNEQFYVIGKNPDNESVKLFAKYNLHVGNIVDAQSNITELPNPTRIQDESAIGWKNGQSPIIAVVAFSNTSTAYSGSIVEEYVNYYKNYLEELGVHIVSARLITSDELLNLGCVKSTGSCIGGPEWLYSSSYWSGTPYKETDIIWRVSDGAYGGNNYYDSNGLGVRPVIEISESVFES